MAGRKRQVGFTLDDAQIAKLLSRSDEEAMSISAFVRRILMKYLNGKLMTIEEHKRLLNDEMLSYERKHGGAF